MFDHSLASSGIELLAVRCHQTFPHPQICQQMDHLVSHDFSPRNVQRPFHIFLYFFVNDDAKRIKKKVRVRRCRNVKRCLLKTFMFYVWIAKLLMKASSAAKHRSRWLSFNPS